MSDVVRLVTYNIFQGGLGGAHLDHVVRAMSPDVLLVNESPKRPLLWRRDCRRLAERWGLEYVVGGRSAGSNMVCVGADVSVRTRAAERLPQPRFQPLRGIASVTLAVRGGGVAVVSCHLSLDRDRRLVEVDRVIATADALPGPVVVAGDLNENPDGRVWRRLLGAGFVDHGADSWLTYPSDQPHRRIDAVLVRGDLDVRHVGDPGLDAARLAPASDHRPVLAELVVR